MTSIINSSSECHYCGEPPEILGDPFVRCTHKGCKWIGHDDCFAEHEMVEHELEESELNSDDSYLDDQD